MPDQFTIINICHLVLGVLMIAVSVLYSLTGVLSLRKKRVKALEVIVFTVDFIILALAIVFLIMLTFTKIEQLPFGVDEQFAITYGGSVIVIPVISEILGAVIKYPLFTVVSAILLVTSQASAIIQIVKWRVLQYDKKNRPAGGKTQSEQDKSEGDGFVGRLSDDAIDSMFSLQAHEESQSNEINPEQIILENEIVDKFRATENVDCAQLDEDECIELIKPDEILVGEPKSSRSKVLRGKTYVKGDARLVYGQYLADKNKNQGK